MEQISWNECKTMIDGGATYRVVDQEIYYSIMIIEYAPVFQCIVNKDDAPNANQIDFETNYLGDASKTNNDSSGLPRIATEKSSGNFNTEVTHNLCDNSTWPSLTDSSWELLPSANKIIELVKAECQFEHDVLLSGTTELYLDYYIWLPDGSEMLADRRTFKTLRDVFELGNEHYYCPAIPTELPTGLTTISFTYPQKLKLYGTQKDFSLKKLVVSLKDNTAVGGSYVTVGFVTQERDD